MIGSAQFISTHLTETIGTEDFFPTVQAAVEPCDFPANWPAYCSMSASSETTSFTSTTAYASDRAGNATPSKERSLDASGLS